MPGTHPPLAPRSVPIPAEPRPAVPIVAIILVGRQVLLDLPVRLPHPPAEALDLAAQRAPEGGEIRLHAARAAASGPALRHGAPPEPARRCAAGAALEPQRRRRMRGGADAGAGDAEKGDAGKGDAGKGPNAGATDSGAGDAGRKDAGMGDAAAAGDAGAEDAGRALRARPAPSGAAGAASAPRRGAAGAGK